MQNVVSGARLRSAATVSAILSPTEVIRSKLRSTLSLSAQSWVSFWMTWLAPGTQ